MRLSVSLLVSLVPFVIADGAAILEAMTTVSDATIALNTTLAPWTGNPLTLVPIVIESASLLTAINNATDVATASANLTLIETVRIAQSTIKLAATVNSSLTTIIAKKKIFQRELLQPVILLNLIAEKDATDKFAAAVVAKVPASLQATALNTIKPIDASFDLAIAEYKTW